MHGSILQYMGYVSAIVSLFLCASFLVVALNLFTTFFLVHIHANNGISLLIGLYLNVCKGDITYVIT